MYLCLTAHPLKSIRRGGLIIAALQDSIPKRKKEHPEGGNTTEITTLHKTWNRSNKAFVLNKLCSSKQHQREHRLIQHSTSNVERPPKSFGMTTTESTTLGWKGHSRSAFGWNAQEEGLRFGRDLMAHHTVGSDREQASDPDKREYQKRILCRTIFDLISWYWKGVRKFDKPHCESSTSENMCTRSKLVLLN